MNAALAALLALAAAGVGGLCRRPALRHGLWLLVLLKLLAPPVLSVPLPWPAAPDEPTADRPVAVHDADRGIPVAAELPADVAETEPVPATAEPLEAADEPPRLPPVPERPPAVAVEAPPPEPAPAP